MPEDFVKAFEADADAVVRPLCSWITDAQLATIAAADYGLDQPEHLVKLQAIRLAGKALPLDGWHPHEVLELVGHSEPDDPDWRPGGTRTNGWTMKAFCTAVLASSAVNGHAAEDLPYHLGGLARSILMLNELDSLDLRVELTQFAAWALSSGLRHEDEPFVGIALLIGALSRNPRISDAKIIEICEWIWAAEVRLAQQHLGPSGTRWLVGNSRSFRAAETWSPIGVHLANLQLRKRSEAARTWVRLLGTSLSD